MIIKPAFDALRPFLPAQLLDPVKTMLSFIDKTSAIRNRYDDHTDFGI